MRAARYYGCGDIRIDDVPEPQVKPGEVKVRVAWNGICGTDVHEYLAGPIFLSQGDPHPLTGERLPVTVGHEFSGIISEVGEGVDSHNYAVGKRVVVEPTISCRDASSCPTCAKGLFHCCTKIGVVGMHGLGGGLGEYVSLPHHMVHVIPDAIPLDVAACIEPICVAWHAVHRANFRKGDQCFIAGSGPIGLFVLKVLKSLGAGAVYVSEPAEQRRQMALEHEADFVFNPSETDVTRGVMKSTNGRGVDVSFECAGAQAALETAIMVTKARGVIMNVASWEGPVSVNINLLTLGEKTLTSSEIYENDHPAVIDALAKGVLSSLSSLITKKIRLEDVIEEGYMASVNQKDSQVKILVHPGKEAPST